MTELLDRAVARIRGLPDNDQNAFAEMLLSALGEDGDVDTLDDASRRGVREGSAQAERGEFVSDDEIAALWRRHGL